MIAGGSFTYLLDGAFSASGTVGLAPLYGGTFPDPAALQQNQSAQSVVNTLLSSAHTGVELAGATVDFTPPSLLQASGTVFLPPPPFPLQFLKGTISIGIDPPHFTGEGSLDLVVPSYVPFIGGDNFGGVQGLISDEAAAAEASTPSYCIRYIGCTPSISVLVAFNYQTGSFTWDIDGGNINDYATVPQDEASGARATNRRTVRVARRQAARDVHDPKRQGHAECEADQSALPPSPAHAHAALLSAFTQPYRWPRVGRQGQAHRALSRVPSARRPVDGEAHREGRGSSP